LSQSTIEKTINRKKQQSAIFQVTRKAYHILRPKNDRKRDIEHFPHIFVYYTTFSPSCKYFFEIFLKKSVILPFFNLIFPLFFPVFATNLCMICRNIRLDYSFFLAAELPYAHYANYNLYFFCTFCKLSPANFPLQTSSCKLFPVNVVL